MAPYIKTLLLPKNEITSQAKNYRPIALQNTMYKVYTTLLADFILDHCEKNGIVTEEQAAGKRGSWGCSDQLLIKKMIQEQVIANRKNLVTVWLDYQKAFDSIPHSWLIRSLELAKVPEVIINAIKKLMLKWRTKVFLHGENTGAETDFINYLTGILQGDTLSLILFVLSVNPLSFLLKEHDGYKTKQLSQAININHLFFVDDLKLYASTIAKMIKLLETVTQFSNDVGMKFGVSKCAYQVIERGKRKAQNEDMEVNGLQIHEIQEGDCYKYLGIDEFIGIDGPFNKQMVIKEYKTRVKKIWGSELNGYNKAIAHNAFAVPVVTPTIGILKWTKKEINDLDIATRKIITMTGGFHQASDIDRLYVERKKGGRGLRSIEDMYEIRMVGLMEHLEQMKEKHSLLKEVEVHERQTIGRLGKGFIQRRESYQKCSNVKQGSRKEHEERWKGKVTQKVFTEEIGKGRDNRYEENEQLVAFKVIIAYRRVYGSSTRARTRHERNKEKKREESAKKERNGHKM